MPNTVVKRSSAHDTGVTKPRENRPVPGPFGRCTSHRCARRGSNLDTDRFERQHGRIKKPLAIDRPGASKKRILSEPSRGGAVVARRAHNPKVSGSNPLPATEQWAVLA